MVTRAPSKGKSAASLTRAAGATNERGVEGRTFPTGATALTRQCARDGELRGTEPGVMDDLDVSDRAWVCIRVEGEKVKPYCRPALCPFRPCTGGAVVGLKG